MENKFNVIIDSLNEMKEYYDDIEVEIDEDGIEISSENGIDHVKDFLADYFVAVDDEVTNSIGNDVMIDTDGAKIFIKESIESDIEDISKSLDIVMNALGLEKDEEESKTTIEIKEEPIEDEDSYEERDRFEPREREEIIFEERTEEPSEAEESLQIKEDLSTDSYKYVISFADNAKLKTWYTDLELKNFPISEGGNLGFNDFEDLLAFLKDDNIPCNDREYIMIKDADENTESGILISTIYYVIFKNLM